MLLILPIETQKQYFSMKKNLATYLLLCTAFLFGACMEDGSEEFEINYYAALRSFGVDSVIVYSTTKLSDGSDTTLIKYVNGESYPFVIDQKEKTVYNPDSLPYGADPAKLTVNVTSDGVAYLYNDSTDVYDLISSSDTLDFSSARRLLVAATGGLYAQEYTVTVNVHKVDPEKLQWEQLSLSPIEKPLRLIEHNGKMMLFGNNAQGALLVCSTGIDGAVEWSEAVELSTLPLAADVAAMLSFNGALYATADGVLFSSIDGVEWSSLDVSASALLAASVEDNKMWAVVDGNIAWSADGENFTAVEALPAGFPTRNVSGNCYPLATNPFITRYLLIGYPSDEAAAPTMWGKLSTEDKWVQYEHLGDGSFDCPAIKPLNVLRYDGRLFAFGGAGTMAGSEVKAFEYLYLSGDNGLTWRESAGIRVQLPEELEGSAAPFAAAVDGNNRIWIVSGDSVPTWRGGINRLLFR